MINMILVQIQRQIYASRSQRQMFQSVCIDVCIAYASRSTLYQFQTNPRRFSTGQRTNRIIQRPTYKIISYQWEKIKTFPNFLFSKSSIQKPTPFNFVEHRCQAFFALFKVHPKSRRSR